MLLQGQEGFGALMFYGYERGVHRAAQSIDWSGSRA